MNEEIRKLINLQEVDSEIAGFDREAGERKKELADREQSIGDKQETAAAHRNKIALLEERQRGLKAESEDAQVRIKERQGKMMQVQTSREHQALLKEIEDAKRVLKESDEAIIAIMEQVEQLDKEAQELENLCRGEQELLGEAVAQVELALQEIETRKKKVAAKREKLTRDVPDGTLKRYNMLLQKCKNNAVVQAAGGVCRGCYMTLPPQQFNEIRRGDRIHHCPTCQRILYFIPEE